MRSARVTLDSIRALMLIRAYRVRGHLQATLDPLGLQKREPHPELDYRSYGFTEADLDRQIFIDNVLGLETATLRAHHRASCSETYCGTIGVEFMHIQDPDQKAWIQNRIEVDPQPHRIHRARQAGHPRTPDRSRGARALPADEYTGTKRFGLDGGETAIPALRADHQARQPAGASGDRASAWPHRGRLNVLTNV